MTTIYRESDGCFVEGGEPLVLLGLHPLRPEHRRQEVGVDRQGHQLQRIVMSCVMSCVLTYAMSCHVTCHVTWV